MRLSTLKPNPDRALVKKFSAQIRMRCAGRPNAGNALKRPLDGHESGLAGLRRSPRRCRAPDSRSAKFGERASLSWNCRAISVVSAYFPLRRSRIHDWARAMARIRAWLSLRGEEFCPPGTMISFRARGRGSGNGTMWARSGSQSPSGDRCHRLADELNLAASNNDSLDGVVHQCARLGAPRW